MHAENLQTINYIYWPSPKGSQFMVKEIKKKNIANKTWKKKEFWGSLKLKFRSLFLKVKKHWQEQRVSLIYWERVTSLVSEMHLRVHLETQQVRKVDLNRTCLFLFTQDWNSTFVNRPDFWFTFPYHPNFGLMLYQFAGFFPYSCVNTTSLPTGFLEQTRADQYAIAPMALWMGPTQMHKICIWPIEEVYIRVRPQASTSE